MAGPDYKLVNSITDPIDALINKLVELNYCLIEAYEAGWEVNLSIDPEGGRVNVEIKRDAWPSPPDEEEEA